MTNFSEVRRRPLIDITKFLFLSLVDSLRDRHLDEEYQKTKTLFQEALQVQDELVLFQGLKNAVDLLTVEKQMSIVFYSIDSKNIFPPLLQNSLPTSASYEIEQNINSRQFSLSTGHLKTVLNLLYLPNFMILLSVTMYISRCMTMPGKPSELPIWKI